MRIGTLALCSVLVSTTSARADGEQMVLPFQCALDRGRVIMSPAPDKTYRLAGPRASHAFTACAPSNPNRCRTWQIHKFDFFCGSQRVPWFAVAASVLERAPQRGRIDNGRLLLRLGQEWQRRDPPPVGFRTPFGTVEPLLAFPVGFAPGLGTGVRFVGSTNPPPTVVDARPEPKIEPKTKPEPRFTAVSEAPLKPSGTAVDSGWSATVTSVSADPNPGSDGSAYLVRGLVGAALVLAAWGGLLFVRRRSAAAALDRAQPPPTANSTPSAGTSDEAALCAELVARAVNLHQASREAVEALPNLNLREILTNDLASIQRRLLSANLTQDVADERWAAVTPVVATALTDLERIARIIAGVLSSQPPSTAPALPIVPVVSMPETAHQAYEALGVNPEASRTIVKKVVDGLRQSWHPDHARDDDDRSRREERMKQINAAWDLIRSANEPTTADAERAA